MENIDVEIRILKFGNFFYFIAYFYRYTKVNF